MRYRHGGNIYPGQDKVNAFCDIDGCKGRQVYPPFLLRAKNLKTGSSKEFWLCNKHASSGITDLWGDIMYSIDFDLTRDDKIELTFGRYDPSKKKLFVTLKKVM